MHNIVQQKAFFELETKKMLEHDMFYKLRKINKKGMKKYFFIFQGKLVPNCDLAHFSHL